MSQNRPGKTFSSFEFWPDYIFFLPVVFYYVYLSVRYGDITLPSVANPGFPDSKFQILSLLPDDMEELVAPYRIFRPSAYDSGNMIEAARELLNDSSFSYPVVVKPDMGLMGVGVRLLHNDQELNNYLIRFQSAGEIFFQKYIDWPGEAGVFYTRIPGEPEGHISSLAFKYSPVVTGDGHSTLRSVRVTAAKATSPFHYTVFFVSVPY